MAPQNVLDALDKAYADRDASVAATATLATAQTALNDAQSAALSAASTSSESTAAALKAVTDSLTVSSDDPKPLL